MSHIEYSIGVISSRGLIPPANGVEGIRMEGEFRCPTVAQRLPPPVPDLSISKKDGSWGYHTPESLPPEYQNVQDREVNDFCPIAQLNKLSKTVVMFSFA